MDNNFVAIDIETAQGKRWSICQIGLAIVENGNITKTISKLVQPPNNEYAPFNIKIHKITPEKTLNSPFFNEVWENIYPIIANKKLVAHNASFDISCLNQALDYYNIKKPVFDYTCTYKLTGEKLKVACKKYNVNLENHHDALCDAIACAKIYLNINNKSDYECINYSSNGISKKENKITTSDIKINKIKCIEFEGKAFCFTGKLAELTRKQAKKEVRARKGLTQEAINDQLDYLVIGSIASSGWKYGNYGNKIKKAQDLIMQESKLKIVAEDRFMSAIEDHPVLDIGEIDQKFLVFRYEALVENGELDITGLEDYLNSLNKSTHLYITAQFEDPNILQSLYGAFEGLNLENYILFRCKIVKQLPLHEDITKFINYILDGFNLVQGMEGEYTYSEKKEGTASYAKLFKELSSEINLVP